MRVVLNLTGWRVQFAPHLLYKGESVTIEDVSDLDTLYEMDGIPHDNWLHKQEPDTVDISEAVRCYDRRLDLSEHDFWAVLIRPYQIPLVDPRRYRVLVVAESRHMHDYDGISAVEVTRLNELAWDRQDEIFAPLLAAAHARTPEDAVATCDLSRIHEALVEARDVWDDERERSRA